MVKKVEVDLASGAVKLKGDISQHVKEMIATLEEDGYLAQVSKDVSSKAKKLFW